MLESFVSFLAILNPFALCLYLAPVMTDLPRRDFFMVMVRACLISGLVLLLFAVAGDYVLKDLMGIHPAALRVFGGVIFFLVGYQYTMRGYRATEALRGSLDELPSAIALPFMIGAGTITQATLMGRRHSPQIAASLVVVGIAVCFVCVLLFTFLHERMQGPRERLFERYINIMSRLNGLLIGTISTEMIAFGLKELWV